MKNIMIGVALGLSVIASSLAVATPASAQSRLRNAYTANGTFYLGVSGGYMHVGTQLIVWQKAGDDQLWYLPPGQGSIQDYLTDNNGFTVCVDAQGDPNGGLGANLIIQLCNPGYTEEFWQMFSAEKLGFGANYPGCYMFYNVAKGLAIGVAGGNTSVKNGTHVIQWTYDTSANQFWCPE